MNSSKGVDQINTISLDADFISNAVTAVAAFAPGFLILFSRNQLLTGRTKSISQLSAEYAVVSAIYYAATLAAPRFLFSKEWLFATLFILPIIIGFTLGLAAQFGLIGRFLGYFGIQTVHPAPTAWDYVFGFWPQNRYVVVTLKDGSTFCGYLECSKSFASSDLGHKDLYISDVTDQDFNSKESVGQRRGAWIEGSEIRSVEFIYTVETKDGQET